MPGAAPPLPRHCGTARRRPGRGERRRLEERARESGSGSSSSGQSSGQSSGWRGAPPPTAPAPRPAGWSLRSFPSKARVRSQGCRKGRPARAQDPPGHPPIPRSPLAPGSASSPSCTRCARSQARSTRLRRGSSAARAASASAAHVGAFAIAWQALDALAAAATPHPRGSTRSPPEVHRAPRGGRTTRTRATVEGAPPRQSAGAGARCAVAVRGCSLPRVASRCRSARCSRIQVRGPLALPQRWASNHHEVARARRRSTSSQHSASVSLSADQRWRE